MEKPALLPAFSYTSWFGYLGFSCFFFLACRCLTTPEPMSQMKATRKAVEQIGLNRQEKVKKEWFADPAQGEMFRKRLASLLAASTTKPAIS